MAIRSAIVKQVGEMMAVTAARMLVTENWMYKARDFHLPIFLMNQ